MTTDRMDQQVRTKVDADTFDRLHELAKQQRSTVARETRLAILDRINLMLGDPSPGHSVAADVKRIAVANARDEFGS